MKIKTSDFQTAKTVPIALGTGSPTINTVQECFDQTGSSGYFTGGILSDGGSGTLDITAGEGFIRTTADNNAPLLSFQWDAVTGMAIPDDTTQYVFVDDSGVVSINTNEFVESQDKIILGVVTDEASVIESTFNLGVRLDESIGQAGRFIRRIHSISRDVRKGGLVFGETGTRNLTLTEGTLWWGRTEYPITAFDSSGADRFDLYYRASPSGWTKVADQSQWPNTQYDDGTGTLNTMTNNQRWAVLWLYIEPDDHVVLVYGRNEYLTQGLADEESPPNTLPPRLSATGFLAARMVFQRNAGTGTFDSAFDIMFVGSAVTDHGNLAGLADSTDHVWALLVDGTRALTGNLSLGDNNITNVADIALDSISSDAGTKINIVLGSDAGDDFIVGANRLVVEGDTGRVGIGQASPAVELDVEGDIRIGDAMQLNNDNSVGTVPDIDIFGNGVIASEASLWINIDSDDDSTTAEIIFGKDARTSTATELMRIQENGRVGIGTDAPNEIFEVKASLAGSAGSHSGEPVVRISQGADTSYAIGDVHGGLEFYTFDAGSSFPGIQAYMRAVTTRGSISFPDAGLIFGVSDSGALATDSVVIRHDGNVGIGTMAPSAILDCNDGSGNMIADGYDSHPSFSEKKENITDVPSSIDALITSPPKKFTRVPFVSAVELRAHTLITHQTEWIAEFGGIVNEDGALEGDSYRSGELRNIQNVELKAVVDAEGDRLRAERRLEYKWQREYTGLIIDDVNLETNLPNIIIKDEGGETTGWNLDSYVGYLHKAIIELNNKVEALENYHA